MAIPDLQTLPSVPLPATLDPPKLIIIERVLPEIDAGRYPVKRVQADILDGSTDIVTDDLARMGATALRIEHDPAVPAEWAANVI